MPAHADAVIHAGPFEWIISYNLGLLLLTTGQYASAFHHLSASINLKPDFAHTYMYLAVTLAKLEDVENACAAYEKALQIEDDMLFHLNYGKSAQSDTALCLLVLVSSSA